MKRKKIFAGLLVGILCACALPILTFAEGETWTDLDLSAVTENGCTLTSGNYRLVEDIRITNSITVPNKEEVTLDLNGYTITETENVPVIEISGDKSSLTLLDSSETQTGTITGGKGTSNQGGGVHNEGTFLMEGGNITGNDAGSGSGGGVYVASSGKFTMNGGVIAGNSYSEISNGGGVCVAKGGEFTMNGGTISANETERYGGGVYVASSGKFTMNGGAITDNTIVFGNNQYSGGGIYNAGTFTMTGGIIAENKCLNNGYGGGVYNDYGTFTMTGGTITGNQATSGGGIYNCNLDSSVTLSPTNADISIYANNATTAPDIYNASGGYLTLSADVNQNLPDYDFLGWYDDNTDQAYTPTKKDKSKLYLEAKLHQHTVVYIEAVDATCTEEGNIGYWQCSDCGACFGVTEDGGVGEIITEEDIILDALGHSLEKVAAIEPTCESEGNIGYWRCTRCGKYFADENGENEITEEDIIIDALGHALETIAEIEPTCTSEGNIGYWRCARCGKYFADENGENEITEEDIIIDALGHALDTIAEIEPTCTSEGNIGYWRCARCGKYFADEKGENEITEEDIIIDALGHALETIAEIEPTCTEEGNIEYRRCARCGKYFADEKGENEITEEEFVLDALGHELEKIAAIEPTCTSEGNIGYWRCERCGKCFADEKGENEIAEEEFVLDALGHALEKVAAIEPTCESEGNIGYWRCTRCGKYFADEKGENEITEEEFVLDALGHELEKIAAIEPTCESEGNIGYWRCTRCGKYFADEKGENEITEEEFVLDALGHELEKIAAIEPTCESEGNIGYWRCARCGKYFADEKGENEITEEDIIIDALGHELEKIAAIEPTCTSEGNIGYWRCARCGKYFADEKGENEIAEEEFVLDALGHELEKIAAIEPTCTEEGNIGYWRCTRCGKYFADENGENEITEEDIIIDALGHALETIAEIEPTCTEEGNIGYWRCTRCGKYFADEKGENEITEEDIIIDALGHDFTFEDDDNYNCPDYMEYVAEVTQTCSTSGCKAYFHCTQCDKYFLVDGNETTLEALQKGDIDPNNHAELIYVPATAAIYESAGNIEYWYCEECGKYFADKEATIEITYSDTVIPMLTEPGVSETTEVVTDTTETVPETTESTAGMTETSETVPETTESTAGMTDTTETVPETTESTAGVTETSETAPDTTESTAGVTETSETVPEATESTAGVTDTTETVPDTTESTADVTDTTETVPDTTESTAGVTDTTETVPDTTESTAGVTETSETVPETTESTAGVTDTSETVPDTTESTAGVTDTTETVPDTTESAGVTDTSETVPDTTESTAGVTDTTETVPDTTESTAGVTDTTETVPDTTESAGVTDTTKAVPETTESTAGVTDTTEAVPDTTESTAGVTDTTEAVPDTTESTAGVTDTTETVPETTESAGVTEESESSTISSLPGDVDFDGEVTPTDSYLCLVAYARAQLGFDSELNELQQFVADVNFDGIVDPTDAYYILVYYATEQIRGAITWEEIIDAWEHTPIA